MRLRSKLAWQFTTLMALALLIILSGVYVLDWLSIRQEFFNRLEERAKIVAYFYWEKAELKPADFERLEQRYMQRLPYEVVRLYDKEHREVLVENNHPDKRIAIIDLKRLQKEKSYFAIDAEYQQTCAMLYQNRQGETWVSVTAYDLYGNKRLQWLAVIMLVCYLISLVFIFFLGRFLIKNGLQHIQNIVQEVQNIQADQLGQRLEEPPYLDEVGELVLTFNQLLERLEGSFQSQKLFVSQASHELRTPIAIMLGEVEVALTRTRSTENYQQTLQSLQQTLLQGKEMINSLLLFTQLGDSTEVPNIEFLRIDELIWEVFDHIKRAFPTHYWRINLEEMPEDMEALTLCGNKSWLKMALHNLMENVIKYGANKPADLTLYYAPQQACLKIRDYGIGIAPEDLKNIFEPFYRGINTRGKIQGTGLGLPLTKRILEAHDVAFEVESVETKGTTITLFFELM